MSRSGFPLPELFWLFLRLGMTSFGGPVAHLAYFREEFVDRRHWFTDAAYADLVALCQFLPGPASSQVVIGIGLQRAGYAGAFIASLGFTLPSMLLMIGFAYGVLSLDEGLAAQPWIHALKVVAAAVVAQAVWVMARTLCPDRLRGSIALAAAALLVMWPSSAMQLAVIVLGGLVGWRLCGVDAAADHGRLEVAVRPRTAVALLVLFFGLLLLSLSPLVPPDVHWAALLASMYQSSSLVFGGGHVLLPLLEAETVRSGWIGRDAFLAGYGAAQALPGPLFTFAAFLGTAQTPTPNGWPGGLLATAGIFLPSFLLVFGVLPFWMRIRRMAGWRAALAGINAAVVGLLLAALYDPVIVGAIRDGRDVALALLAFALLVLWRLPAWVVVLGAAGGAAALGAW